MVGVVAHEGGHVEGGREAGLPVVEQETEAGVGVLGGTEARELAHRPEPPAVHAGVDAAGVGELPRKTDPFLRAAGQILRRVERLDLHVRDGGEAYRPLGVLPGRTNLSLWLAHRAPASRRSWLAITSRWISEVPS